AREELTSPLDPAPERGDAALVHRAEALLPPLAEDPHGAGAEIEIVHVQAAGLADAEPGSVEQLEQRSVPEPERPLLPRHRQDRERLVDRKDAGKPGGKLRAADGPGGVGGDAAGGDQMAVQGSDRRERAGAAPRGVVDGERPQPTPDGAVV